MSILKMIMQSILKLNWLEVRGLNAAVVERKVQPSDVMRKVVARAFTLLVQR